MTEARVLRIVKTQLRADGGSTGARAREVKAAADWMFIAAVLPPSLKANRAAAV